MEKSKIWLKLAKKYKKIDKNKDMNYLNIIKQNWQIIALVTLALVVLSLIISLIQPFEYRSRVEFLIIQKQNYNLDAYAAARASEKMASNLATVVKTKSFFDKVMDSNFGIDKNRFPKDENKLRKVWQNKISARVFPETSILSVDVYDKNKKEANKIASGIAYVLVNNSAEYYGGGNNISIKVVNAPLVTRHPARPNIALNILGGLILGLILSSSYVFYNFNKKIKKLINETQNSKLEFEADDNEDYRREKIKSIFAPQIKTMRDNLPDYEEI